MVARQRGGGMIRKLFRRAICLKIKTSIELLEYQLSGLRASKLKIEGRSRSRQIFRCQFRWERILYVLHMVIEIEEKGEILRVMGCRIFTL